MSPGPDAGSPGAGPGRQWHVPAPGSVPAVPPTTPAPAPAPQAPPAPRSPIPPVAAQPAAPPQPAQAPPSRTPPPGRRGPASPPSGPSGRPPAAPKGRRRWRRWVLVAALALMAIMAGMLMWMFMSFRSVERIDLADVLDPVTGDSVNYLLVGSDSRENLDPEAPDAAEPTVAGQRADTIILLRTGPDGSTMMSIPRDLWVTNAATGEEGRVNGAYNAGPANLVATVRSALGVPVNHYTEVDFASFAGVIDAVGGITIEFPNPVFDRNSGLQVDTAGPNTLDGTQALAYVRSRQYTEVIDGQEVKDPTGDLGRQQRQQQFLTTALAEVGGTRNPWQLANAGSALSTGLTIDTGLSFGDALGLARSLSSSAPTSVVLPTRGTRIGGAAVLVMEQPEADQVLATFR